MIADVAVVSTFMFYSLIGAVTRALFGIYRAYSSEASVKIKWIRVAVEIIASLFFGTFGSILLQEMGVFKLGTTVVALLAGFFGADLIGFLSKKVGVTESMEMKVTEEQVEFPELSERQIKAMEYLRKHGRITNDIYQRLNKISHSTAKRDLDRMVELNNIKKHGTGRGTYYAL